ncbi:Serine/threonine-protein kinase pkn1 [Thalassoglobus polymorphus]|uniref:Serine/threonine-protein kinase pkn1 n=2 Tax=Thalassoglobus polymorphus TaxID=2527994 RepID=A0A517QRK1_9PLAN|nr:Serine/threonine-protein kinase pkn1 [Thalassoglobus polymorphus]
MWRTTLLLLLGTIQLYGCGDSKSVPPPPVKKAVSTPPPPVARPSVPKPKALSPAPKQSKSSTSSQSKNDEERAYTSNDFELQSIGPTVEVIPPQSAPPQNRFAVVKPASDSSKLTVELPSNKAGRTQQFEKSNLKLPGGFVHAPDELFNERGFPQRIVCTADGAEMVLIDGGVFTQGTDQGPPESQPEHLAFVSPFYMDVTEVTLEMFRKFQRQAAEAKPVIKIARAPLNEKTGDGHDPVLGVAWKDAASYATMFGKALPTEAEWERAARGSSGNRYPWGNGRRPITPASADAILAVGSRPTDLTPTGLFDMAGNAREWTRDWYADDAYQKAIPKDGSPVRNSEGPRMAGRSGERVVRGSRTHWNLWERTGENVRGGQEDVSFRCILRITDEMIISTDRAGQPNSTSPPNQSNRRPNNPGF